MIPVDQTKSGYPKGNCVMACVASILEVSLDDLPDLFERCCSYDEEKAIWNHDKENWWDVLLEGVQSFGWEVTFVNRNASRVYPQGYAIAGGDTPREDVVNERGENVGHSVVYLDGKMIHDPHPSRDGLKGPIQDWIILLPKASDG